MNDPEGERRSTKRRAAEQALFDAVFVGAFDGIFAFDGSFGGPDIMSETRADVVRYLKIARDHIDELISDIGGAA